MGCATGIWDSFRPLGQNEANEIFIRLWKPPMASRPVSRQIVLVGGAFGRALGIVGFRKFFIFPGKHYNYKEFIYFLKKRMRIISTTTKSLNYLRRTRIYCDDRHCLFLLSLKV
jgi:hypothetical protein